MATCFHCKTEETALYENGVPICIACANARDAKIKQGDRKWGAAANGGSQPDTTFRASGESLKQGT